MIIDFTAEEITDMIWALRMFAEIKQPASMVERMRILELKLQTFVNEIENAIIKIKNIPQDNSSF